MNQRDSSILARALHGFFTEYLPEQRAMSPHTLHSYRDSLKLVLQFVAGKNHDPSKLTMEDLTVPHILAFLQHLEAERGNKACTRNVRLTAIHSFFRFVGGQYPQHLAQTQRVLAIPFKRTQIREIEHLDLAEMRAVLDAIDRSDREGRRDFALLSLLFNTGARVSEIVEAKASDLRLTPPSSIVLHGKGPKTRTCPLWPETARLLREHLEESGVHPDCPETLFRNHWGRVLTRFGIRFVLQKYVRRAALQVPSLKRKRLHPHSIRHGTALYLLRSGVDLSSIAHWLGHADLNTTNKYLALDLEAKRDALAKAKPLTKRCRKSGSWRGDPDVIAWLENL